VFIVTGFKAETIENHFGDGARWNARIAYGRQLVQDGTGKAPELARDFIGASPFLLTYGDILVKPETYLQMVHRYNEDYFSGVITVTGSEDVTKGGLVFFDDKFCLKRLVEKPSPEQVEELRREGWLKTGDTAWYNAGIYIFRPSLFEYTARLQKSPRGEYELTDALSALVATQHRIAGMKIAGRWVDVRDPEVLASLEAPASRPARKKARPNPRPGKAKRSKRISSAAVAQGGKTAWRQRRPVGRSTTKTVRRVKGRSRRRKHG
jgi:dTDP-glucose pyrophosphorylase